MRDRHTEVVRRIVNKLSWLNGGELIVKNRERIESIGTVHVFRYHYPGKPGRPDIILWIRLKMNIERLHIEADIPVLLEVELGEAKGALEDFTEFMRNTCITLPAFIITEKPMKQGLLSAGPYEMQVYLKINQLRAHRFLNNK